MSAEGDIFTRIRRHFPHLHPALKRIAQYVLEHPEKVKIQIIGETAAQCGVSVATVTRFVKRIGLNSFQELKIATAERLFNGGDQRAGKQKFVYDDVAKNDSIERIIEKITFKNIDTLNTTKTLLVPADLERAVKAIEKADVLAFYCSGSSIVAGQNAKSRFYRVGKKCLLYSDSTEQNISASLLDGKSVAIGITSSGRTRSVVNAMKISREAGATTICITDSPSSPVVNFSDICFFSSSTYSSFLEDSMTSRMPHILIIDILYACFAVKHYQKSLKSIEKTTAAIKDTIFYPNGRRSPS
jgi:DNA-binding MurR/RpiR family transcriptional regulator